MKDKPFGQQVAEQSIAAFVVSIASFTGMLVFGWCVAKLAEYQAKKELDKFPEASLEETE